MVEHDKDNEMDDQALDQILGLATPAALSADFERRLLARLPEPAKPTAQVIAFPRKKSPRPWVMTLPLAACLVLGVWLGASGQLPDFVSTASTTTAMASPDQLLPSGVDDIENLSSGDLS
jgi:anti-sigma factor RsiW